MSTEEKRAEIKQTGRAWVVAIIAILAAILIAANNNKIPATSSLMVEFFGLNPASIGFLMSLNGYVGIILAFFAPLVLVKFGTKHSATIVFAFALVGCFIMTIAPNYPVLVIGKLIEGAAYSLVNVVVPVLISEWFPPTKRGLPMGIFSIWVPIGAMFIMSTSGFFFNPVDPATFHRVFWYVTILLVIIIVLWIIAGKNPEHSYVAAEANADAPKVKISDGFKSLSCWIIMIAFAAFSLGTASVMNMETLYFVDALGMDQMSANGLMNILNISVIVAGLIIGFALNKVTNAYKRLAILVIFCILQAVTFALAYNITGGMVTPWLVLFGIANGIVPPIFMTMITQIAPRPELAGVASSMIALGVSVGGLLFSAVSVMLASGWGAATGILSAGGVVLVLCPIVLIFLLKARDKKVAA